MTQFLCLVFLRHEELLEKGELYADMWQQQLQAAAKQEEGDEGGDANGDTGEKADAD